MGAVIPTGILGYEGQVIKEVRHDEATGKVTVICRRDQRRRLVDPVSGRTGLVNRWMHRTVRDIPLGGRPCEVEIEYAQIYVSSSRTCVEALPFVAPGVRATRRFARLVSGLCRHMSIDAVARHTGLSWHSVKAMDMAFLVENVEPPRPELLEGIRYLGVDEVARAKGHHYLTLVYDLTPGARCGGILWVREGRDSATMLEFLGALSEECAQGIEAVAMDMGPAYIAAVQKGLPSAAIVFDRFHVAKLANEALTEVRREEANKLAPYERAALKGTRWILLKRRERLDAEQEATLAAIKHTNAPVYRASLLKESFLDIFTTRDRPTATRRLGDWLAWPISVEAVACAGESPAPWTKTVRVS